MQKAGTRSTKRKKEVEIPKQSIIHSKKLRNVVPVTIAGIIIILVSFFYPPLAENSSIQTPAIVFACSLFLNFNVVILSFLYHK